MATESNKGVPLKLWGRANSINVQKVLWLLGELDLGYERVDAGREYGVVDTPEYRRLNPNGLIPTLQQQEFVLWESNAILRYLAGRYGPEHWYPRQPEPRALVDQWLDWQLTTLGPPFSALFRGLIRTPEHLRDPKALENSEKIVKQCLDLMERRFDRTPFFLGAAVSLVDIALGTFMHRWFNMPVNHGSHAVLESWYHRLSEREPYRQFVMLPVT